ncbi:MAG: hypothetical protein WC391_09980 [Methanoregula sp.]
MTGKRGDSGACASCGLPRSETLPEHVADPDGRLVCDRCWHDPALWFFGREMEIYGSPEGVTEAAYRKYHGVKPGQATLFSLIPDVVRKKIGGSP